MSEDKNINVSVVPKFAETALENVLDKPSKSIGETFSDIWYLVLGGALGQMAEKRKMKYAADLEKYKKKIEEEIEKIPDNKRCEPDIQIIGSVLEASKYCAEKEELRNMFAKLIASSLNDDKRGNIIVYFIDIIKNMSVLEAKLITIISANQNKTNDKYKTDNLEICDLTADEIAISLVILVQKGLIEYSEKEKNIKEKVFDFFVLHEYDAISEGLFLSLGCEAENKIKNDEKTKKALEKFLKRFYLSRIGEKFAELCIK